MRSTYKTTRRSDVANQLMLFIAIVLLWLCTLCTPAFAEDNSSRQIPHNAKMSYLENRLIKVGVDWNLGEANCLVEGHTYSLKDCATAMIPRGRVHYFINESSTLMDMIWVYAGPMPERILIEPGFVREPVT